MAAIQKMAEEPHAAGVMPTRTLREFNTLCLTPEEIRALRVREDAGQAVFARHLNVSVGLVKKGLAAVA